MKTTRFAKLFKVTDADGSEHYFVALTAEGAAACRQQQIDKMPHDAAYKRDWGWVRGVEFVSHEIYLVDGAAR